MELTDFASLIASGSTNTAKNTLSYLIGNGLVNNNWSKALAKLYMSFPEDIRTSVESKKEFFPVILKYFTIYQLTQDNISIYNEYEHLYTAKHKDDLKKFNPYWTWQAEPEIVFKNALTFTNALPIGYHGNIYDFIKQYEKQLDFFIEKQKDKIVKHFTTRRIWDVLIKEDYFKFLQFCDKYEFDRVSILKDTITEYSNLYNEKVFEQEGFNFFLDDLVKIGKENLKMIKGFYPDSMYSSLKRTSGGSVFTVLTNAIGNNQYKSAMKWMMMFEEEMNNYAKLYGLYDIKTSSNFKQILQKQIVELKKDRSHYNIEPHTLEMILKNDNWFKFMDTYELYDNLNEKLQPKLKTKQTKI